MALTDITQQAYRAVGNMALASGAAVNGTTGTFSTTITIPYLVNGIFASKGAMTNQAPVAPTTALLGDAQRAQAWAFYNIGSTDVARTFYMVLALDSAGNPFVFQGTFLGQDLAFRGLAPSKGDGLVPVIPEGTVVPFALVKVQNPANLAFTVGTTPLTTASGRTVTFWNVGVLPASSAP